MSNESIKRKKLRIRKFLNWLKAQKRGATKHQLNEWLFDNYALSESSRAKYIQDLILFQYLIVKGTKFYVNVTKLYLF